MSKVSKSRVLVVYGTRPEAIKLAPLITQLKKSYDLETIVVCTGQHKELLEGIFEIWNLSNDVSLKLDFESKARSIIPDLMRNLEPIFESLSPSLTIVQGDTSTAFAGALVSHSMRIPIAHLEAGLRSADIWNPWPEESFRRAIDGMSSLHFAPTSGSISNLEREGHLNSAYLTGNTVVDALKDTLGLITSKPEILLDLQDELNLDLNSDFVLFTQHRREGFGKGQSKVFEAIIEIANSGVDVVFPVHLNPNVIQKSRRMLSNNLKIHLIKPLPYLQFVQLTSKARLIISDSGGLQEEVPCLGKRIIITRETTERPEVIEEGFGKLAGYDKEAILSYTQEALGSKWSLVGNKNVFGDGQSSSYISSIILEYLRTLKS